LNIRSILYSEEPRLRAGWRLLLQTILLLVFIFGASLPLGLLILINPALADHLFIAYLISFAAVTASVFLARILVDRRDLISLGLKIDRRAGVDLLAGILITLPMMGLIYLILWAAGWLTLEGFAWEDVGVLKAIGQTLLGFFTFILVGWSEELLSRGYHLQNLESGLNTRWAVLLSSGVFALLHIDNPNAGSVGFVIIGLALAGLFLAFGYLRTRQLWLPIGLHIGWNFFEGVIFGFPVSGLEPFHLTRISLQGPMYWTGGAFGPEAGLVLIPGLLLGFLLVYCYTRGRTELSD